MLSKTKYTQRYFGVEQRDLLAYHLRRNTHRNTLVKLNKETNRHVISDEIQTDIW